MLKRAKKTKAIWRDNATCKNFLVWECPCDFFINESGRVAPKSPFGECVKQHSEASRIRFKEDAEYRKYKHRYLEDLEKQLQPKIKAMDDKIASEKEALILKVEAEKDKLEAAGKLETAEPINADGRPRRKEEQDEVCEVCGTYSAFTGGLVMRHEAGLLHVGWGRLRESFAGLKKEVEASKQGLTNEERLGATEERERSRSIAAHKSRDQRRDRRDGRKDVDDERDRDRDRDMRKEHDQKSRNRESNTRSDREYDQRSRGRERDSHSGRGRDRYDDRRNDTRDRDRDKGRRRDEQVGKSKRGRSAKEEDVDEFGRAKTIDKGYRNGEYQIKEEEKRQVDNRSRSREARKSRGGEKSEAEKRSPSADTPKSTGAWIEDTEDCKVLQIQLSEDWQEVMNRMCQESQLSMTLWEMSCLDKDDNVLDMAAKALNVDSFPLKFKFARKPEPPPCSEDSYSE